MASAEQCLLTPADRLGDNCDIFLFDEFTLWRRVNPRKPLAIGTGLEEVKIDGENANTFGRANRKVKREPISNNYCYRCKASK